MKKQPKTSFEIKVECVNCGWKGSVQAETRERFLHWKCPRCDSRYCATTSRRVKENERTVAEGLRTA